MKSCKNLVLGLLTVALVLLCVFALPQTVNAASVDDLTFKLNETRDGYIVSDCNNAARGELVIPATYNGLPVTAIGNGAFYECDKLTSVTIPDSVTSIGDNAFYCCSRLTSVTIPDSVTTIDYYAFYNCDSLTSITIPDSVTSIGGNAFCDCNRLTSITIPDSVTSIGNWAFTYCESLTSVTIGDSVNTIGEHAFYDCDSLTSVTIGDSVTSIGDWAFYVCESLTSITIPDSVTSIGEGAFYGCDSLTSITIPDSVTSIDDNAFNGCESLTSVTIGDSVTSIGYWAFSDCNSLISILVEEGNPVYHSAGNCMIETNTKTLIAGCKTSQIPADGSVTSIGEAAFSRCTNLTSITIPNSVTTIDTFAFYYCSRLTSITIPDSVTTIGHSAFYNCSNLTSVTYCGTQEQWDAIEIGSDNEPLLNAELQFHDMEDGVCTFCQYFEGQECDHVWQEATCETPKTCTLCEMTEGEALGHNYVDGTCACGAADPNAPTEPETPEEPTEPSEDAGEPELEIGWTASEKYNWLVAAFTSADEDLIFEEGQAYDWVFTLQQGRTNADLNVKATVYDANGAKVAELNKVATCYKSDTPSPMLSAEELPELANLTGEFILVCDVYYSTQGVGRMVQTFSRTGATGEGDTDSGNEGETEAPEEPTEPETPEEPEVMLGDSDGNGKINLRDAILVLKAINGGEEADASIADVDGNGKVNLRDAILILKYANGTPFPEK